MFDGRLRRLPRTMEVHIILALSLCCLVTILAAKEIPTETPCAARFYPGQSSVCVCNATYCDEVTRTPPKEGHFVAYTSSKAGSRFRKFTGKLKSFHKTWKCCSSTFDLYPDKKFQTIEGFGSAVTDSGAINWKSLPEEVQQQMIKSYFSDKGSEYNILRVPIGGSDFSVRAYAYNELPVNDTQLTNYTLSVEDYEYKIPMIKAAKAVATAPLYLLGTTWSPPPWMKTSDDWYGFGMLKDEYYQTYADYHLKFIEKYTELGLPIWGLTTTNEPLNGVVPLVVYNSKLNCLGWTSDDMGRWIVHHLGPTIRKSKYNEVKILAIDDQRYAIATWYRSMEKSHPNVSEYLDGIAVHYYGDGLSPVKLLQEFTDKHPKYMMLATEACEGAPTTEKEKVLLGSWTRAEHYISDIITDLVYNVVGWLDWNIALDVQGGPTYVGNYVDSTVIVFPEKKEFVKQPMFYALGHVSKFIPRGSRRIELVGLKKGLTPSLGAVAFVTPRDTIAVVIHNKGSKKRISVKLNDDQAILNLEESSITTVEIPYSDKKE